MTCFVYFFLKIYKFTKNLLYKHLFYIFIYVFFYQIYYYPLSDYDTNQT